MINITVIVNNLIKDNKIEYEKIHYSNKKVSVIQNEIIQFIKANYTNCNVITNLWLELDKIIVLNNPTNFVKSISKDIDTINNNIGSVETYMSDITDILNDAVYGHEKAKRHVERIVGQWINGEKSGYCFGFEGPPGVGKTSLAKRGLAKCLKDENGVDRPFAFIAIGGSSNGSTLEGHNYTYVGSTWGRIVDILIE